MKTLKLTFYCLLATAFCLLVPSNSKAQDDANAGIYIDGTFVDKIDCWTFNNMSCIFPITEKFKKYDVIVVQVKYDRTEFNRSYPDGVQSIFTFELTFNQEKLEGNFGDAKYGVYKFLRDKAVDNRPAIRLTNAYGSYTANNSFKRNQFAGWDETKPGKYKYYKYKSNISFDVFGATINGYAFDDKGVNKAPIFENIVYLYKSSKIPINNCESCPWDINATCPLTGKKVDVKIENSLAYEEHLGIIKK